MKNGNNDLTSLKKMSEVLKASDFGKLEKIIKIVEDKGQIACYETMDDSNEEIHMRYQIETERSDLFDVNIVITMKVCLDKEVPFDELKSAFDKACKVHEVLQSGCHRIYRRGLLCR